MTSEIRKHLSLCRLSNGFASRTLQLLALIALPFCLTSMESAVAQSGALGIEDAIRAREFAPSSRVQFSPDGKWLVYTVMRTPAQADHIEEPATVPWFGSGADIFVIDTATGTEKAITGGQFNNWWPVWSPDGSYVAFLSDRDGSSMTKIWVWSARDGTLRKVSDVPAGLGPIEWMPDGHQVIFSRSRKAKPTTGPAPQTSVAVQGRAPTVTVYDVSSQQNSGPWSLSDYLTSLELADIDSGRTKTIVEGQIGTYRLSPDGSHLAFTVAERFEEAGSQQILFDLRILDVRNGKSLDILRDLPLSSDGFGFSWSPDSNYLCLRSSGRTVEYFIVSVSGALPHKLTGRTFSAAFSSRKEPLWNDSAQKVYFVEEGGIWSGDIASGQIEKIADVAGRRIRHIIGCRDGVLCTVNQSSLLVVTHDDEGKQDGMYSIDVKTGRSRPLMEQGQCYTCIQDGPSIAASSDGRRIAFIAEDAAHPPDLWLSDIDLRARRRLTNLNPNFDTHLMGTARLVGWLSDDGQPLKGALLLPSHYQPGERYPLITYVYGGNLLSDLFDRFGFTMGTTSGGPLNMQLLATRGYAVFVPDAPQGRVTAMLDLAKTILPGINRVIDLGIADPHRLGIMGQSYGGYSALSLIVLTTRFKAAIALAGFSDLLNFYGEMTDDGAVFGIAVSEQGQVAMGGTPWDHRDKFIENSPFFYLDRIQTPLLIVQGTKDTAVAPFLGDQTFVALRRLGKEVVYAKYRGEAHSPGEEWDYSNQVDLCDRMLRWWDDHLNQPLRE